MITYTVWAKVERNEKAKNMVSDKKQQQQGFKKRLKAATLQNNVIFI